LGLAVYVPSFRSSFHLDDFPSIVWNLEIRTFHNVLMRWQRSPSTFVSYLTFVLNYQIGGLNVISYHIFNFLIHLGASLSLFFFARTVGSKHSLFVALLAGLIFVAHPIQTQAITYIVQRNASLATLFYITSLLCYAKYRHGSKGWLYGASILAALLAMYSKATAYTLPITLIAYEVCFHGFEKENVQKLLRRLTPFFLLLVLVYVTVYHQSVVGEGFAGVTRESSTLSRSSYFFTQLNVICTYLRLIIFPIAQNLDYDYPIRTTFWELRTIACSLVLLSLFVLGIILFRKQKRMMAFGIFWFFITLSIESSIIPITDVIFEHRLYLPMIGVTLFVAPPIYNVSKKYIPLWWIVPGALVLTLGVLTFKRNQVWTSELTLWTDVVNKSPQKARALTNLGLAYKREGEFEKASSLYREAIKRDPNDAIAHVNAGDLEEKLKRYDQAISYYEKAIEIDSSVAQTYNNLGKTYGKLGRYDLAVQYLSQAIEKDPFFSKAHLNLAVIYSLKGNTPKEIELYLKAIQIDPRYQLAYRNLGLAYAKKNQYPEAVHAFQTALSFDPSNPDLRKNLETALKKA
jgi:protein O-mannosyl-transferase